MRQTQQWEKVAGFSFGVVFVTLLLVINVLIPHPSITQHETFRIILALSAAGVGGILTGFVHIEGTFNKLAVRAGGALALFLIVFFLTPPAPQAPETVNQTIIGNDAKQIGTNKGVIIIDNSTSTRDTDKDKRK